MSNQQEDAKRTVEELRESIIAKDEFRVLQALKELVCLFFAKEEKRESFRRFIEDQFQVDPYAPQVTYDKFNISEIIEAFETGEKKVFYFASGTWGERLFIDGKRKIVWYNAGGLSGGEEALKRFIALFGSDTIQL